jgi:hypothetical protein
VSVDAKHPPHDLVAPHTVATTAIANSLEQRFDRVICVHTESFLQTGQYRGVEVFYNTIALAQQHLLTGGTIYCQTFSADQPVFQKSRTQVVEEDLQTRTQLHYPPFGTLVLLIPRRNAKKASSVPIPIEQKSDFITRWPTTIQPGRWLVRTAQDQRLSLLHFLHTNLEPTWEAVVDPAHIPHD